jgi:hypothetical protein
VPEFNAHLHLQFARHPILAAGLKGLQALVEAAVSYKTAVVRVSAYCSNNRSMYSTPALQH